MSDDCIFCKIIAGDLPCSKVYEDDHVLAFNDINPKARVHVLVVPKTCFDRLHESGDSGCGDARSGFGGSWEGGVGYGHYGFGVSGAVQPRTRRWAGGVSSARACDRGRPISDVG